MAEMNCPDYSTDPEELKRLRAAFLANAEAQGIRPLSIGLDGFSISFGSAAENMQAAKNTLEMQQKQLELQVALCPWVGRSVARG